MSQALKLTVTMAGRAALVNAEHNGTGTVLVAAVGVTAAAFTSDAAMTALPSESKRITTISGGATAADTIHVTIRDNSSDTYTVRGIGLYLQDGTLFGVYGQSGVLAEKSAQASLLLATDTKFADINASSVAFGDTNFQINKATTATLGVVQLAASSDVVSGTDASLVVTPATFKAALDDRFGATAPTKFTKPLLATADAAAFRSGLGVKGAALKEIGHGNGLDADTLDGFEGQDYRDFRKLTNVPDAYPPGPHSHALSDIAGLVAALAAKLDASARYAPGQMIVFAGTAAPAGTLLCDGAAYSRAQYAALFKAIGTRWGAGDGTNTFNVPNLKEGTAIRVTLNPNNVGSYSAGVNLTHSHGANAAGVADHTHYVALYGAGGHSHGASESAAGDHGHSAWTDAQGSHTHGGSTTAAGGHSHPQDSRTVYPGYGNARIGYTGSSNSWLQYDGGTTGGVGDHAHNISTDWQGSHGHNIGMNGSGNHTHTISIAAVGDHAHNVDFRASGGHSHAITISSDGGTDNLPAGSSMLHCIAY